MSSTQYRILLLSALLAALGLGFWLESRHSAPAPPPRTIPVSARAVEVVASDLVLLGNYTQQLGMENPHCGMLKQSFSAGGEFFFSSGRVSTAGKGRWFFTLNRKPISLSIVGTGIEIHAEPPAPAASGGASRVFFFHVEGDLPASPTLLMRK